MPKPDLARTLSEITFSSQTAPNASTFADRWAMRRIHQSVSTARLRFLLWDGFEVPSTAGDPVGTIVFKNRHALWSWIWDPELNFGEAYMFQAVEIRGELVPVLEEIYRTFASAKPPVT